LINSRKIKLGISRQVGHHQRCLEGVTRADIRTVTGSNSTFAAELVELGCTHFDHGIVQVGLDRQALSLMLGITKNGAGVQRHGAFVVSDSHCTDVIHAKRGHVNLLTSQVLEVQCGMSCCSSGGDVGSTNGLCLINGQGQ